ncbi:MAG: hypothetical protein ABII74_05755 [Elusimicrobiota bacterium]
MKKNLMNFFVAALLLLGTAGVVFGEEAVPADGSAVGSSNDSSLKMVIKGTYQDDIVVEKINQPKGLDLSSFVTFPEFSIQNLEESKKMPEKIYYPPAVTALPEISFPSPALSYVYPTIENLDSWNIKIIDSQGKIVVRDQDKGIFPKLFTWDGFKDDELIAKVGDVYSLVYQGKDNQGKVYFEEKSIRLDCLIRLDKGEKLIGLSLASILAKEPELKMLEESENFKLLLTAIRQNLDSPINLQLYYPDLIEGDRILTFITDYFSGLLVLNKNSFNAELCLDGQTVSLVEVKIKESFSFLKESSYPGLPIKMDGGEQKVGISLEKHLLLANKYLSVGLAGAAIEEYKFFLTGDPNNLPVKKMLNGLEKRQITEHDEAGKKYFSRANYHKALQEFSCALAIAEDSKENSGYRQSLQKNISNCNQKIEKIKEARRQINENIYQGLIFYRQGSYAQAIDYLIKVLQADPQNKQAKHYIDLSGGKLIKD